MKQHRSYSDHEIACYVLGLDMPDHAGDIQARLARDDAAAACALKWEAYFLGIADALPPAPPPEALLMQIRATLGMEEAPVVAEPRRAADEPHRDAMPADESSISRRIRRLSKRRVAAAIGGIALAAIIVLLIWASLRPAPGSTQVQQTLHLESN